MKISKEKLKQIIKEELRKFSLTRTLPTRLNLNEAVIPTIIVTTQKEYDALPTSFEKATKIEIRGKDWIEVKTVPGNATVHARDSSTVVAYGSSKVSAYDSSIVVAYGSSTVVANGSSTISANGSSTVHAFDDASVELYDDATIVDQRLEDFNLD